LHEIVSSRIDGDRFAFYVSIRTVSRFSAVNTDRSLLLYEN